MRVGPSESFCRERLQTTSIRLIQYGFALSFRLLPFIGGAIVPVIIGRIGDYVGLRNGMAFLYLTFGFVLSVGFWAKPLISNATIRLEKASVEAAA